MNAVGVQFGPLQILFQLIIQSDLSGRLQCVGHGYFEAIKESN